MYTGKYGTRFDQAIKMPLQKRVLLGFLRGRNTFAHLLMGYGKSLIYQLAVRVAAELSVVYNYKDLFSTEPVVLVVSLLNAFIKDQL